MGRGGPSFGGGGPSFGGGGPSFGGGGPSFGRGPRGRNPRGGGGGRARRGDVRIALLTLIAEEPRNGYQLMQAIEERSGGRWRPSPGSVYPTLSQLEDEKLVRASELDGTKLFEITDEGRERLEQSKAQAISWDGGDDPRRRASAEVGKLIGLVARDAAWVAKTGDEHQAMRACEVLSEARRALYRILAEDGDA